MSISVTFRYVNDHRLCWYFTQVHKCITVEAQPALFMCGSLMQNLVLRAFMWIIGLSSCTGNIFVLLWRVKSKTLNNTQMVQAIFTGNLALSDLLMGIYMLILALTDLVFGDYFYQISDVWRESMLCRVAGFLVLLSSETSLLMVTFTTIDRFLNLVFPFSHKHFGKKSACLVVSSIWILTTCLSLSAVFLANPNSDYYSLSDVCIGLPFTASSVKYEPGDTDFLINRIVNTSTNKKSKTNWFFSIAIFLGLNSILIVLIIVMYVVIFIKVQESQRKLKPPNYKKDILMSLRMGAVALSNFSSWLPVILLSILSRSETVSFSLEVYVWLVVFVLPLNASLNPFLYTIVSLIR